MTLRLASVGAAALPALLAAVTAFSSRRTAVPDAPRAVGQQGQQSDAPSAIPFGVGERMEYDVRFGHFHVGTGDMEVLPMDTVRGHQTWHTLFHLSGGYLFYKVNDRSEDWCEVSLLSSLPYHQDIAAGR